MKIVLTMFALLFSLNAQSELKISDAELKNMIARMLIVGFEDSVLDENSSIVKDLEMYDLGGVILFDRFYSDRNKTKNISSPQQLKKLTDDLKTYTKKPLFISVDQEGGKVARLKEAYGFEAFPSAAQVGKMNIGDAIKIYKKQSKMLQDAGINMNFAPVVDLQANRKNKVIVGLERSFSADPRVVSTYAKVVMQEQKTHNIISSLKHFPGHGSSLADSHQGFVDITQTYSSIELEPYAELIQAKEVDMIMTAHVFNSHVDKKYPATLSYKFNTNLLRDSLGFDGIIISDDLQMAAISEHYTLKERVTLAINAGVNILLFGNQLESVTVEELVNAIFEEVKSGNIDFANIKDSNTKIENLQTKFSIIQKPIVFTQQRKELTREYIKKHYGLSRKSITITPKIVVLHWTADMDFNSSFERLNPEILLTDRTDIAEASALNVSAHFLVARDGTIYQLMPDDWMARHVIGLNYSSIGVENIGGENNTKEDLTPEQLEANIKLVKYLQAKYPSIQNVIGHHEYRKFEKSSLWLEKDDGYRTQKADPGDAFMLHVREALAQ